MSVHILKYGQSRCDLRGPPRAWPEEDTWISADDTKHLAEVDCWHCICIHLGKPIPTPPASPEHDKVAASNDLPQKLCEFVLEFLPEEHNIVLATRHHHGAECYDEDDALLCGCRDGELYRASQNVVDLAAAFIGVDAKAYNKEKDATLKYIRELNALSDWAKVEGRSML